MIVNYKEIQYTLQHMKIKINNLQNQKHKFNNVKLKILWTIVIKYSHRAL